MIASLLYMPSPSPTSALMHHPLLRTPEISRVPEDILLQVGIVGRILMALAVHRAHSVGHRRMFPPSYTHLYGKGYHFFMFN